jgi:hypothetical protein
MTLSSVLACSFGAGLTLAGKVPSCFLTGIFDGNGHLGVNNVENRETDRLWSLSRGSTLDNLWTEIGTARLSMLGYAFFLPGKGFDVDGKQFLKDIFNFDCDSISSIKYLFAHFFGTAKIQGKGSAPLNS